MEILTIVDSHQSPFPTGSGDAPLHTFNYDTVYTAYAAAASIPPGVIHSEFWARYLNDQDRVLFRRIWFEEERSRAQTLCAIGAELLPLMATFTEFGGTLQSKINRGSSLQQRCYSHFTC